MSKPKQPVVLVRGTLGERNGVLFVMKADDLPNRPSFVKVADGEYMPGRNRAANGYSVRPFRTIDGMVYDVYPDCSAKTRV